MSADITLLTLSAAAIAFVHTILGPDHYLPFVAMARAKGWSLSRTLRITLVCGAGHLAGSVALGLVGIALGIQLSSLTWLEGIRGSLAAWLLIGFGLAYTVWGLRQAHRNRRHTHWHHHDGVTHVHEHDHHDAHAHVHEQPGSAKSLTPWLLFVIFVLGPCEPLIPLLMYPAARVDTTGMILVTAVFGIVTVLTMLATVAIALTGLNSIGFGRFERFGQVLAGATILVCGLGIQFLAW
jgi:ABC-type nickel/cobalt efflux system permease component RcnA